MQSNEIFCPRVVGVETLEGSVMPSGFAKNVGDMTTAEALTRKVDGVRSVKNEITVRP